MVVRGDVPGIPPEKFSTIAAQAKDGCPVGKALGGITTSLDVALATTSPGAAALAGAH